MKPYFEQHDKIITDKTLIILLLDLAKQRGVHPDKLLKGSRLFQDDLAKPQLAVSQSQIAKLIINASKLINSPDIAFILGTRLFPTQMGKIGLALSNTRNIEDMLRIIKCNQSHIFPFMFIQEKYHKQQRYFLFNHAIAIEDEAYHIFMAELLMSVITSAIKWRLSYLPEFMIKFSYSQPQHIEQYQAYFGNNFSFHLTQEKAHLVPKPKRHLGVQISITNETLRKPFSESNHVIKRFHLNQLGKSNTSVGIIQYIIQTINQHFKQGGTTLENVAKSMNISAATLKRKLAAHNTSYQQLLDLYRQQQAIFLLTELGQSNEEIACALRFSDITNFRRSFKRWTGFTPNDLKLAYLNYN